MNHSPSNFFIGSEASDNIISKSKLFFILKYNIYLTNVSWEVYIPLSCSTSVIKALGMGVHLFLLIVKKHFLNFNQKKPTINYV